MNHRLGKKARIAISLETGVKNSTLTIAVIGLSFSDPKIRDAVLVFPLMYSVRIWLGVLSRSTRSVNTPLVIAVVCH